MKLLLSVLIAGLLLPTLPCDAELICALKGSNGKVALWRSDDAFHACLSESQATGRPGTICDSSLVGTTDAGTKAQYLGSTGFLTGLSKVRVLEGEYVGREAVVVSGNCDPSAPISTAAAEKDNQIRGLGTRSPTQAGSIAANAVLQNASYQCAVRASAGDAGTFWESGFKLVTGRYEAPPEVPGSAVHASAGLTPEFTATGDMWGDGREDAVALTFDSGGGTGTSLVISVFRDVFGEAQCTHTISLGDRVKVRSIRIEPPDTVFVGISDHAPGDPSCCPSRAVERKFKLSDARIEASQRISGGPWMPYRPAYWSVESRINSGWRSIEGSVWSTPTGFLVWRAMACAGRRDSACVSSTEQLLKAERTLQKGDRLRARELNAAGLRLLRNQTQQSEAATILADAHIADPGDAEIANNLGFSLLRIGDVEGAVEALVDALSRDPSRKDAWLNLGEALGSVNLSEPASGAFRLAMGHSANTGDGERVVRRLESDSSLPGVIVAARTALSEEIVESSWRPPSPEQVASASTMSRHDTAPVAAAPASEMTRTVAPSEREEVIGPYQLVGCEDKDDMVMIVAEAAIRNESGLRSAIADGIAGKKCVVFSEGDRVLLTNEIDSWAGLLKVRLKTNRREYWIQKGAFNK